VSLFSKQKCYCCACGQELERELASTLRAEFCDPDCRNEFNWRMALSVLGKAYYPEPEPDEVVNDVQP